MIRRGGEKKRKKAEPFQPLCKPFFRFAKVQHDARFGRHTGTPGYSSEPVSFHAEAQRQNCILLARAVRQAGVWGELGRAVWGRSWGGKEVSKANNLRSRSINTCLIFGEGAIRINNCLTSCWHTFYQLPKPMLPSIPPSLLCCIP